MRLNRFNPNSVNGLMLSGENDEGSNFTLLPEVEIVEERAYLVGKTPFEPWRVKWWKHNRVPMWQKGVVVAVAAIAADQALNKGKFTNPLIGKKARK